MFWGLTPEAPSSGKAAGVEGAETDGQRYPTWGSALVPGTALSSCRDILTVSLSDIAKSSLGPHAQEGSIQSVHDYTHSCNHARDSTRGHRRGRLFCFSHNCKGAFALRARNCPFSGNLQGHGGLGMGWTRWQRPTL